MCGFTETLADGPSDLDEAFEFLNDLADLTEMPARLVKDTATHSVDFFDLDGVQIGTIYLPRSRAGSFEVQNMGEMPHEVPSLLNGVFDLLLGYLVKLLED